MAEDGKEGRGFTVSDRRRFSSEGTEAKPGADEGQREEDEKRREETGAQPGTASASSAQSQKGSTERGGAEATSGRATRVPEITMSTFIMSMSTQVLMLMGEIDSPVGQEVERDMNAAKQVIDILGMLREKTKGNLDKSEEALLDNVLYDLRVRYVDLHKSQDRK